MINPYSDLGKETQNPFLDTRIRIWIFPKKRTSAQSGEQVLVLVTFRIYARRSPKGRSSDLYCPIRENYELAQKNETECFQVLNMASLARRNLQAINLLPDMLW